MRFSLLAMAFCYFSVKISIIAEPRSWKTRVNTRCIDFTITDSEDSVKINLVFMYKSHLQNSLKFEENTTGDGEVQ